MNTQKFINKLSHFSPSLTQMNTLYEHTARLNFHGVLLEFCLATPQMKTKVINHFKNFLTEESSSEPIQIFWHNPEDFDVADLIGESADSNCQFYKKNNQLTVIQRDFIAISENNRVNLIANLEISDGVFNFLRWLIPRKLLKLNKLILHSSCVIDDKNMAYVCLGPSGAGKTTIASLTTDFNILGDDMNLLEFINGQAVISASGMGQRYENPSLYNQKFVVKKFYWLQQGKNIKQLQLQPSLRYTHALSSVANLFWDQLSEQDINAVQALMNHFLNIENFYQLEFPKNEGIWDTIKELP